MNESSATQNKARTLSVLLPLPLMGLYDYALPETGEKIEAGHFVEVPLGQKKAIGVVWGKGSGEVPQNKLKAIERLLPLPPVSKETRNFINWVADYTLSPPGPVLKMLFGGKLRESKKNDSFIEEAFDPSYLQPELSESQAKAADNLIGKVRGGHFSTTLLDGVTGSGKTEVYCEAIAEALRQGKQVLVLLPEIAMTAALIDRFAKRFGARPIEWHSELSEKQKRINWQAILEGKARFILGARSALFLPYVNLGLIVVDEEHESSYKQEDGVVYHGRDMAVVRAHLGDFPIILASATPSLETYINTQKGKYDHLVLKERFGGATLPEIKLVDLRREALPATRFLSAPLLEALTETVEAGNQAMLFLNRRGYAPLTLCRACGHRLQCPHCTSWLIEHKRTQRLHCHQCGYSVPMPKACPSCGAEDHFAPCGPGIERIAEEIKGLFPNLRMAILASDTLSGPKAAEAIVAQMEDRSLDLLIGTQIMAKGYHFPRLTFVGVVDADLGLSGSDPRASERTFQLLQQMAGRSGRGGEKGIVYLQTTAPEHPVMQALLHGNRNDFLEAEIEQRSAYKLPPFTRLASLILSGPLASEVEKWAKKIASTAPRLQHVSILGPAPAPITVLRGKTRYRLLVRAHQNVSLQKLIAGWLAPLSLPRSLRLQIDIDPYSFL